MNSHQTNHPSVSHVFPVRSRFVPVLSIPTISLINLTAITKLTSSSPAFPISHSAHQRRRFADRYDSRDASSLCQAPTVGQHSLGNSPRSGFGHFPNRFWAINLWPWHVSAQFPNSFNGATIIPWFSDSIVSKFITVQLTGLTKQTVQTPTDWLVCRRGVILFLGVEILFDKVRLQFH
jgi:hypothetical protein